MRLRSLDDHMPLPGITIGDIGMKFGNGAYNTMDNGVLRFDRVRIPRNQMLMRLVLYEYLFSQHHYRGKVSRSFCPIIYNLVLTQF